MKPLTFFMICCITLLLPLSAQKQDEKKIAEAMADRLTVPCTHITLEKHEKISIRVETKEKKAYMLWMGNKIVTMRVTLRDLESEQLSIRENFIDLKANGMEPLTVNRAAKSIGMVDKITGRWADFGKILIDKKSYGWYITLKKHQPIRMTICEAKKTAWVYFNHYEIFHLNAAYKKIKGSSKKNLTVLEGSFPQDIYLNRSRKILFFKKQKNSMPGTYGTFCKVSIKERTMMK